VNRHEAFENLKAVQNEFAAATFSVGRTLRAAQSDPSLLAASDHPLKPSHLRDCSAGLEITYILRLFAEFEAALRDYWAAARPARKRRRIRMELLMERIAALQNMPADTLRSAHAVREYRNEIVHDRRSVPLVRFDQCKSYLGHFLSFLPVRW
jgi:hypothetical protein